MLLNLSNHPSDAWPEAQLAEAMRIYGSVQDLAFPNIPPSHGADDVRMLVDSYEVLVRKSGAYCVHVMGEATFVYGMVQRLKSAGIPCVASTTERDTVQHEDGSKTFKFRFVRFRHYF